MLTNVTDRARFWAGRAVAITGATGFVGYHVATQLAELGARVTALVRPTSARARLVAGGVRCVEGSLEDQESLVRACRGCEFAFHLAAAVDFEGDWSRFERVNVHGTRNVLAAARAAGVRRLIHTSSLAAVGALDRPRVLDETFAWNLGRFRVPYCTTKRIAEEEALAAAGRELEVVVVNPTSVLGPEDYSRSEFGVVCRRFWRGRLPFHFGGGNNFVDVRDVARGQLLAAERGRSGERYILGGSNRTYAAFFAALARVAPRPIARLRLPTAFATVVATLNDRFRRQGLARSYLTRMQLPLLPLFFFAMSAKAGRELDYQPRPLPASLRDTYAFWMGSEKRQAG